MLLQFQNCKKRACTAFVTITDYGTNKRFAACFLEVRLSNEAARKLYESEKFRILGKRKSYYRNPTEDAIIMSRKLKTETMK